MYEENDRRSDNSDIGTFTLIVIALIMVALIGFSCVMSYRDIAQSGSALEKDIAIINGINSISSGVIIDKEIVNGRTVNGSGGFIIGNNGSGFIIGGNKEYIPTRYLIHIRGEYQVDGNEYSGVKDFEVPLEIYQIYNIGDFFDSKCLLPTTAVSVCPSCGASCDTPFCGACGTSMNTESTK